MSRATQRESAPAYSYTGERRVWVSADLDHTVATKTAIREMVRRAMSRCRKPYSGGRRAGESYSANFRRSHAWA